MKNFKMFTDAITEAESLCGSWKDIISGKIISKEELLEIYEKENMDDDEFFVVSMEGAIGYFEEFEYNVIWMYLPASKAELSIAKEEAEEEKPKVEETAKNYDANETTAEVSIQEKPVPNFCRQRGNKLRPGVKFCSKCGMKI